MVDKERFHHTHSITVDNIILELTSRRYYRVLSRETSQSMDYGGITYDTSYFNLMEVDPKSGFKETGVNVTMSDGEFALTRDDVFVVLDE